MKKLPPVQNPKVVEELIEVLTTSFLPNELLGEKVFKGNRKGLRAFMDFAVQHYLQHAQIFVSENNEGKVVAGALFLESPKNKAMGVFTILQDQGIGALVKLFFGMGIGNLIRLLKVQSILEKTHYQKEHAYLFMLGSVEKGKGGELLEYCKEYYKNQFPIYLESSVTKNHHEFYRKHGFTEIGRVTALGYESVCFIGEQKGKTK